MRRKKNSFLSTFSINKWILTILNSFSYFLNINIQESELKNKIIPYFDISIFLKTNLLYFYKIVKRFYPFPFFYPHSFTYHL